MTVKNVYPIQFEELRCLIKYCLSESELQDVGIDTSAWNEEDWRLWGIGCIEDDLVIKSFEGYDFTCDDFFRTAGNYEEYPDIED